jgi:hypothetical protein
MHFFSLGQACIFVGGLHPHFGAERYLFGGRIVELTVAVGNRFVASKRVVLRSKMECFRNGPCHVEAIAERSILQMLISRGKFIGFWKEIPVVESVTHPICRMRRLRPRPAPGGGSGGRRHAAAALRAGGRRSGRRRRHFFQRTICRAFCRRGMHFFPLGQACISVGQ